MWQTLPWHEFLFQTLSAALAFFLLLLALGFIGRSLVFSVWFLQESWALWYLELKLELPARLKQRVEAILYERRRDQHSPDSGRLVRTLQSREAHPYANISFFLAIACLLLVMVAVWILPNAWGLNDSARLHIGETVLFNSMGVSCVIILTVFYLRCMITALQVAWLWFAARRPENWHDPAMQNCVAAYRGTTGVFFQATLLGLYAIVCLYFIGRWGIFMLQKIVHIFLG